MKTADKLEVTKWEQANTEWIATAPQPIQNAILRVVEQANGGSNEIERKKLALQAQVLAAREAIKELEAQKKADIEARKQAKDAAQAAKALKAEEERAAELEKMAAAKEAAKEAAKKASPKASA